jgi:penicillin-binding protein 2
VYIAALTNGGTRYAAHLLHHVEDVATKETVVQSRPEILSSVAISETHRDGIIDGMERVISTSGSISRWMRGVPVTVAGKTGTAQVGGKADDNGLFVCCAPSNDPDIAIASVVEHAGGGSYAALAASRVLEAFYAE